MCNNIQGPVVLGYIEIPVIHSLYSECDHCGARSRTSVYIRSSGEQLCDDCERWEEMGATDTARSIFDTHEDTEGYDDEVWLG